MSPGARKTTTKEPSTRGRASRKPAAAVTARTSLAVVLFTDIEASTALKRTVAKRADEHAFQHLRERHDEIVARVIGRDGGGQVVKWTGDGVLALFPTPSVAVERALEIQEQIR